MGQSIKVSTAAAVAILPFHKDVLAACKTAAKSGVTLAQKLDGLLVSRYGETAPTFEQYRADQAALRQMDCSAGKLGDIGQYVRKQFAAAVKAKYGELPVSMDAAAVAKRAQREAADAAKKKADPAAPVGAPAGETQERQPSEAEQIESVVTRLGLFRTLEACINILKADKTTAGQAVHMEKQFQKLLKDAAVQKANPDAANMASAK